MWPAHGSEPGRRRLSLRRMCSVFTRPDSLRRTLGTGPNQNDSIVLSRQAVQRGLGLSLFFNNTMRFDVHTPYRLFADHPDIPGGLGFVLPGHTVSPGSPVLAVIAHRDSTGTANEAPILRTAKGDSVGIVHRVVITLGNSEGYVITPSGCYNLHTFSFLVAHGHRAAGTRLRSAVKLEHIRHHSPFFYRSPTPTSAATPGRHTAPSPSMPSITDVLRVRIITVALRESGCFFLARERRVPDKKKQPMHPEWVSVGVVSVRMQTPPQS